MTASNMRTQLSHQHASRKLMALKQRMRSIQARAVPAQNICETPKRPAVRQLLAGMAAVAAGLQLGAPAFGFTTGDMPLPLVLEQQQVPIITQLGLYEQHQDLPAAPALTAPLEDVLVPTSLLTDGLESVADSAFIDSLRTVVEDSISATNLAEADFTAPGSPSPSSSSLWASQGPLCYVWQAYCSSMSERPMFTKMLTGMLGTLLGDLLAQALVPAAEAASTTIHGSSNGPASSRSATSGSSQRSNGAIGSSSSNSWALAVPAVDWSRTARLMGYSALVGTPLAALWFGFLDANVFPDQPTAPLTIGAKMALDQLVNAPVMTALFFAAMSAIEGRPGDALRDVQTKLKPTLMASYCLWPLAHVINFGFIDPQNRILYINLINIGWTAFMSHMANSSQSQAAASAEQPSFAPARAIRARTSH